MAGIFQIVHVEITIKNSDRPDSGGFYVSEISWTNFSVNPINRSTISCAFNSYKYSLSYTIMKNIHSNFLI